MSTDPEPIRVDVTAEDIRKGEPGNECLCPVALAVSRATNDTAEVSAMDGRDVIWTCGRIIKAPRSVIEFVREFDDLDRGDGNPLPGPFAFELPPLSDPAWRAPCDHCEGLFAPTELDDDGLCEECRSARIDV